MGSTGKLKLPTTIAWPRNLLALIPQCTIFHWLSSFSFIFSFFSHLPLFCIYVCVCIHIKYSLFSRTFNYFYLISIFCLWRPLVVYTKETLLYLWGHYKFHKVLFRLILINWRREEHYRIANEIFFSRVVFSEKKIKEPRYSLIIAIFTHREEYFSY